MFTPGWFDVKMVFARLPKAFPFQGRTGKESRWSCPRERERSPQILTDRWRKKGKPRQDQV